MNKKDDSKSFTFVQVALNHPLVLLLQAQPAGGLYLSTSCLVSFMCYFLMPLTLVDFFPVICVCLVCCLRSPCAPLFCLLYPFTVNPWTLLWKKSSYKRGFLPLHILGTRGSFVTSQYIPLLCIASFCVKTLTCVLLLICPWYQLSKCTFKWTSPPNPETILILTSTHTHRICK